MLERRSLRLVGLGRGVGTQLISLLSGKGGVGKTVLAYNLAERFASALGRRVLLVDADFGAGNVHILANAGCDYGIGHFLSGRLSLKEAVTSVRDGFDILASTWYGPVVDRSDTFAWAGLVRQLREESGHYDVVLFDHSSAMSEAAGVIAHGSDVNLLVIVPELTSLANGYGLLKTLVDINRDIDCRLLINRTESAEEAEYVTTKFLAMAERFLGVVPAVAGFLTEDDIYRRSIAAQKSICAVNGEAPAVQALTALCQRLAGNIVDSSSRPNPLTEKQINKKAAAADM
jgi:flagellar biosynthesis protein FlhG